MIATKGHEVAIKRLKTREGIDDKYSAAREISLMSKLDHPAIITFIAAVRQNNRIFIVMERMSCSLADIYEDHGWSPMRLESKTKFFLFQLLKCIEYLHSINIVHRDIKPANMLVSVELSQRWPQIKMSDFGIARVLKQGSRSNSLVGTLAYLAPEVLDNRSHGKEVDLWSVGALTYCCITGCTPFGNEKAEEISSRINEVKSRRDLFKDPIWREMSSDLSDFFFGLLKKEPSVRMKIDEAVEHDWFLDLALWKRLSVVDASYEAKGYEAWLLDDAKRICIELSACDNLL